MGTGKILHCCPKESKKGPFGLYVRIIVGERHLPLLFICPNLLDQAISLLQKARISVMNNAFGLGYLSWLWLFSLRRPSFTLRKEKDDHFVLFYARICYQSVRQLLSSSHASNCIKSPLSHFSLIYFIYFIIIFNHEKYDFKELFWYLRRFNLFFLNFLAQDLELVIFS